MECCNGEYANDLSQQIIDLAVCMVCVAVDIYVSWNQTILLFLNIFYFYLNSY